MTAALKLNSQPPIPSPPIQLGEHGMRLWADCQREFGDWLPHDLVTLTAACIAWEEITNLTEELAKCRDFKKRRQLRSDRNAAATTYRQQMRELALSAAPADTRPPRIAGRYR